MPVLTDVLETATRQKIDLALGNLHWQTNEFEPNCNVTTGRARTNDEAKLLRSVNANGAFPDYVLYDHETWEPIAIIEAKRPGSDMPAAIQQARDYAVALGCKVAFAIDGGVVEAVWVDSGLPLRENGLTVSSLLSLRQLRRFVAAGTDLVYSAEPTKTREDLITIFKQANDLLRQEGMRAGLERFTEFSNLLFLKLIDEIEDEREANGEATRIAKRYRWSAFKSKPAADMLDYINDTVLPKLVDRYNHSGDVFARQLAIQSGDTLKAIVDELDKLTLLDVDSDVKGDAFEYFIKNSVTVGNDLGEYYTPRHVVRLMVELVDPKFGETVYDPCCGTGGFLIEAFRHVRRSLALTRPNLKILEEQTIYGGELTGTAKLAKMNMILAGDGHANIVQQDSLEHPAREAYDVVLSNFPFSQRTQFSGHYGLRTHAANPVFIAHIMDALKPGGRAAVVVPDGTLFGTETASVAVRKRLLTEFHVDAVIQLDPFVFAPYTKQPTSILVFRKLPSTDPVWFFDVRSDGFAKSTKRLPIDENDITLLRSAWTDRLITERSFTVPPETIVQNDSKLFLNAYIERVQPKQYKTLGELCERIVIGATPSRGNYLSFRGDVPWAKIGDLGTLSMTETTEYITEPAASELGDRRRIPAGSLLMSFKLTLGRTAITATEMYSNEAIAWLDLKDEYNTPDIQRFLYYVLPLIDYRPFAQRAAKGLTLNSSILTTVEVPFPDADARSELLSRFDAMEDERTQLRDQLAQLAVTQGSMGVELYDAAGADVGDD